MHDLIKSRGVRCFQGFRAISTNFGQSKYAQETRQDKAGLTWERSGLPSPSDSESGSLPGTLSGERYEGAESWQERYVSPTFKYTRSDYLLTDTLDIDPDGSSESRPAPSGSVSSISPTKVLLHQMRLMREEGSSSLIRSQ